VKGMTYDSQDFPFGMLMLFYDLRGTHDELLKAVAPLENFLGIKAGK